MRSLLLPICSALVLVSLSSCGRPDDTRQDSNQISNQEAKVKEKVCEDCDEEALNAPIPGKEPSPEEKAEEEALKNIPVPTGKPAEVPVAVEEIIPPLPERNPLRNPPSQPQEQEPAKQEPAQTDKPVETVKNPEPTKQEEPIKKTEPVKQAEPIKNPEPLKRPEPVKRPEPAQIPKPIPNPEPAKRPDPIPAPKPIPRPEPQEAKPSIPKPAKTLPPFKPSWGLNKKVYTRAKAYFEANHTAFPNQKVVTIVDMSQHSSRSRFFLFHLTDGRVESHRTSHGEGSDLNNDGYADSFSNTPKSLKTSLGAYRTLTTYDGNHGNSLRLQGLSPTNSNALRRAVVVHGARYLNAKPGFKVGRSWGCPALAPNVAQTVIKQIKGGSLLYIAK